MKSSVSEPGYPTIKNSADQASQTAQRNFISLNVIQLGLLVSVSFAAGVNLKSNEHQHELAWTIAVLMFAALAVSTLLKAGKFDDRWFRCRAYAENFKSSVWRYVMSGDSVEPAEAKYIADVAALKERLADLQYDLAKFDVSGPLITDWMHGVKKLPLREKVTLYRELRIEDQISWYSTKARFNARREEFWLWSVIAIEFLAVLLAAVHAIELLNVNPAGGIAAAGTAFVAWTQMKRFSDLDTSYTIAAEDLRLLAAESSDQIDQASLDKLVRNVEKAVSREHSMWLKRRLRAA